jgi:lysophospholipase L1-like esterase
LLKLTACKSFPDLKPDVVIVSLGHEDLARATTAAEYERHLAALADLIAGSWRTPLVLVTPPPYPDHTEAAKAYAAALRRTAAARSLPVADLFTAFIGLSEPGTHEFFQPDRMSLSQAGHNLAAQLIARTLMTPGGAR